MTRVRCAACGEELECLASGTCWCMDLPAVFPVPESGGGEGCWCLRCLEARRPAVMTGDAP